MILHKLDGRDKLIDNKVDGNKIRDNEVAEAKNHQKTRKIFKSKKMLRFMDFFTFRARLAFIELRKAFVKVLIFYHFDLKYHIRIKTDVLEYVIDNVFSQLILDNLS